MKKITVFFLFFTIFCTLSAWDEFNQYSIADELRKPGVKLVAVDFYATWCEPCNAAIPKWKKLQEKYGDKGFKLIVVSVQSEGSCSQPPQWNPDKIVCDYDGDIADAWHANDLPQAFLWSWQGNLLVAHGSVDNVAAAVESYFKKIPRVYVEEGNDENLYKMVRSKLRENAKIEIVASDEERKALVELRKKSADLNYDQKLQCKLGEEISANSRLVISTQKRGKKDALVLELFSVEKGCLTASGTATIHGNSEQEVAEAVYNLLKNLLGDVKMPGEGEKPAKMQKQPTETSDDMQDMIACEKARNASTDAAWKGYLAKFPNGKCKAKAQTELQKFEAKKAATYRPYKTAGISLMVVGAVVVTAGVATFHVLSDKEIDRTEVKGKEIVWDDNVNNDDEDIHFKKANTYTALEITSGVLGGAALVTGIFLVASRMFARPCWMPM